MYYNIINGLEVVITVKYLHLPDNVVKRTILAASIKERGSRQKHKI